MSSIDSALTAAGGLSLSCPRLAVAAAALCLLRFFFVTQTFTYSFVKQPGDFECQGNMTNVCPCDNPSFAEMDSIVAEWGLVCSE